MISKEQHAMMLEKARTTKPRKPVYPTGYAPGKIPTVGERGGHPSGSHERPKIIEWMQAEQQPLLAVLKDILVELKTINAKMK